MTQFECFVIWLGASILAVPIIAGWLRYRRIEQEREEQAALGAAYRRGVARDATRKYSEDARRRSPRPNVQGWSPASLKPPTWRRP
jgi:hypothetical protein